jgi:hypothetical protein
MPFGARRFEFVSKTPWIASALVILLFGNTFAGLVCLPAYHHFARSSLSDHARVPAVHWYEESGFVEIQFGLLPLIAIVLIISRKNVRYSYRGTRLK